MSTLAQYLKGILPSGNFTRVKPSLEENLTKNCMLLHAENAKMN